MQGLIYFYDFSPPGHNSIHGESCLKFTLWYLPAEISWHIWRLCFFSLLFLQTFSWAPYNAYILSFWKNVEKYSYKIQIFFIRISAKKQLIMPLKQDMSPWNLIYYMLQFLMEQNKAIYHDCCFKRKVRGEAVQTPSQQGWWKLSASL